MRESKKAEMPVVWAVAGAAPNSGSSLAAFLLAGMAVQSGRKVLLFRPGQWDAPQKSSSPSPSPLPQAEMARFFDHLDSASRDSVYQLYGHLNPVATASGASALWVLDLGCSRSHSHWDLFWSADLALLVTGPQEMESLNRAVDSALQRWLERALAVEDDSLHAFFQRQVAGKKEAHAGVFFSSSRLRQLGSPGIVRYVTLQRNGTSSPTRKMAPRSLVPGFPVRLEAAGVLICDCPTALVIRDLQTLVHPMPLPLHHWLLQRLEARFDPAAAERPVAQPGTEALLTGGLYTQLGCKQILNIDLHFFDFPAVVSPFAAAEEGL
ncbi:MAG TPA: hypothetical protein PLN61_04545 [bacterium]|nr:hypothetical protein [bacterium]HQI47913.1 hypothetical protein [bacterium]HQJ66323.1 hypothetical protein [bacterium]